MNADKPSEMPDSALSGSSESTAEPRKKSRGGRTLLAIVVAIVLVISGLGMYWSIQPKPFDVIANAKEYAGPEAVSGSGNQTVAGVPGAVFVSTALGVAETLLKKPGGYTRNDMLPPGVLMDNMPNWEYGVLNDLRDTVRSLRNDFSRSQSQSVESEYLKDADSNFAFRSHAWFLPSAEEMYRDGVKKLESFLAGLMTQQDSSTRFFARADNLTQHLQVIEKRLGSFGQQLAASVGDPALAATLKDKPAEELQSLSDHVNAPVALERTPWNEIDDVFYQARGYAWALLHMMRAIQIEFRKVLEDKNAEISMQQIIRELENAVVRKYSPIVLNGHGFGMLANHSLVLASYLGRANAAIIDLRNLMERG